MQNAVNLWNDYFKYKEQGKDVIIRKETNGRYIKAMEDRYGTEKAKDNAFKNQVKEATSNATKK